MSRKSYKTIFKMDPNFEWSLKPFIVSMKFVLGLDLSVSSTRNRKSRSYVFFPAIGMFIIISYLSINGPCGFFSFRTLHDRNKRLYNENPVDIAPEKSEDFFELLKDFCRMPLFLSTPIIHLFFMGNVLFTRNWKDLCFVLLKIEQEMRLGEDFHRKCRNKCLVALGLLVLVILLIPTSIDMQ